AGRSARQPPSDRPAPIMAGNREGLLTKMVREPEHVRSESVEIIRVHASRLVTEVVASLIRSNNVKAALGERCNLFSPAEPKLGKSVEQEDQRTARRTGLRYMQLDAIRRDPRKPRIDIGHSRLFNVPDRRQ